MKTKKHILFLLILINLQSCKAQQSQTALPKIENYTKGELQIMVETFGSKNPIDVGKVSADGTIHFNFPKLDLDAMEENEEAYFFSMRRMDKVVGMFVCHDKEVVENTETVGAIEIRNFFLYKYGQIVGEIRPATEKKILENDYAIGSTISWFYSEEDGKLKASCIAYEDDEIIEYELDRSKIRNKTSYDINFKKGWNIVVHSLLKKKDMTKGTYKFSRRLIEEKTSVATIPANINWYLNYTANDEELEKRQLSLITPISKQQFIKWVPNKLGDLALTTKEHGNPPEGEGNKNTIHLIYTNKTKNKEIDLYVVDCANTDDMEMINFSYAMENDGKDEKDIKPYIAQYSEEKKATAFLFKVKDRIFVEASGVNINAEDLWEYIQKLNVEKLLKK